MNDNQSVQITSQCSTPNTDNNRQPERQPKTLPGKSEHDGAKSHNRTDRKIDSPQNDNDRHGNRDQRDLAHEASLIEEVGRSQESIGTKGEDK